MTERDWEAAARHRVECLLSGIVSDLRDAADEIERESKQNLACAEKAERDYEWQSYPRVAGQAVHRLQTLLFNLNLDRLIEVATDAEKARNEKQNLGLIEAAYAVADENRDGDTPDSGAVRQLVREADRYKKARA